MKEFQQMQEWGMTPESMKFKEGQDEQNLTSLRTYMKKWFEEMKKHPLYADKLEKCTHSTFLVKYSNVCPLIIITMSHNVTMFRCIATSQRC